MRPCDAEIGIHGALGLGIGHHVHELIWEVDDEGVARKGTGTGEARKYANWMSDTTCPKITKKIEGKALALPSGANIYADCRRGEEGVRKASCLFHLMINAILALHAFLRRLLVSLKFGNQAHGSQGKLTFSGNVRAALGLL